MRRLLTYAVMIYALAFGAGCASDRPTQYAGDTPESKGMMAPSSNRVKTEYDGATNTYKVTESGKGGKSLKLDLSPLEREVQDDGKDAVTNVRKD